MKGVLLLIAADLDGMFYEDLAAAVIEGLEERLAFEAWADAREANP